MVNRGFKPELETYNHMISIASFVMESSQKQWEFVQVGGDTGGEGQGRMPSESAPAMT